MPTVKALQKDWAERSVALAVNLFCLHTEFGLRVTELMS